jgi:hypothetical protein
VHESNQKKYIPGFGHIHPDIDDFDGGRQYLSSRAFHTAKSEFLIYERVR